MIEYQKISECSTVVCEALCLSVKDNKQTMKSALETIAPGIMHFVHVYCLCMS